MMMMIIIIIIIIIIIVIYCRRNPVQKKPGETIKETSRRVRPERVSRFPNCMLLDDGGDDDDDDDVL